MSLSCTRVCEAAGATKALGWHLFGFGYSGLAGWLADWLALAERLSLYAFLTSAAIQERQPKGSPKGRQAAGQPARQPVRQSARHNDGDKSLSSSVSTRNVAKSTNVSAAGVRDGDTDRLGDGKMGRWMQHIALGTCHRSGTKRAEIQRLLTQIVHNQF